MVNRAGKAIETLEKIRGLPAHHPRVEFEIREVEDFVRQQMEYLAKAKGPAGLLYIAKEAFTVSQPQSYLPSFSGMVFTWLTLMNYRLGPGEHKALRPDLHTVHSQCDYRSEFNHLVLDTVSLGNTDLSVMRPDP